MGNGNLGIHGLLEALMKISGKEKRKKPKCEAYNGLLVQMIASFILEASPLPETTLPSYYLDHWEQIYVIFFISIKRFSSKEIYAKMSSAKWWPLFLCLNMLMMNHNTMKKAISNFPVSWLHRGCYLFNKTMYKNARSRVCVGCKLGDEFGVSESGSSPVAPFTNMV